MPSLSNTLAVLACGLLFAGSSTSASPTIAARGKDHYHGFKRVKYLFSFGDSYTQTGFNLTNGSPLPAPGNPLGNPTYPGWTSSNGPNWIGYLTTKYNASELLTYNFAYGGATIDSALVRPWRDDVLSVKNQVEDLFLPNLGSRPRTPKWKSDNSLFSFWIGINDIGNSYWLGDFPNFHAQLMDVYFSLVEKLYATGARNFLFLNVPPLQRTPLMLPQGEWALTTETEAIASYNSMLVARVAALKKKHRDVYAEVFDTNKLFNKVLDEPQAYGLKNTTAFCEQYQNGTPQWTTFIPECGIPVDEYFWLNSLHPGFKVNDVVAKEVARKLK